MSVPNEELSTQPREQLCEAASHETDTQKLLALTRKIDRKLEGRAARQVFSSVVKLASRSIRNESA